MLQAMSLHRVFEWDRAFFAPADALQRVFGEVEILEIVQMLEDGFARVVRLHVLIVR